MSGDATEPTFYRLHLWSATELVEKLQKAPEEASELFDKQAVVYERLAMLCRIAAGACVTEVRAEYQRAARPSGEAGSNEMACIEVAGGDPERMEGLVEAGLATRLTAGEGS